MGAAPSNFENGKSRIQHRKASAAVYRNLALLPGIRCILRRYCPFCEDDLPALMLDSIFWKYKPSRLHTTQSEDVGRWTGNNEMHEQDEDHDKAGPAVDGYSAEEV